LPAAARAIVSAASDAVTAAVAGERETFDEAVAELAGLDAEQVRVLLGHVVRSLLEELHPDGLSADDIRDVLPRCVRAVIGWHPEVDAALLIVVLSNALGIGDPDDEPRDARPGDVTAHGVLLIADLVTAAGPVIPAGTVTSAGSVTSVGSAASAERPIDGYLEAALAEIARAETIEMP
jgi:hypothetical protein